MRHEYPEYWAYGLCCVPDPAGRLPAGDGDEDIDFPTLEVRPAPPSGSSARTLAE
ncbi:hypothetical protein [Streptomyces sp. NPDC096105]|uniref:hypothetical protein n=1 Tax=Streptomyces sp. NPDC096105 TaxID=3366074 RepID=UPI0037FB3AFC